MNSFASSVFLTGHIARKTIILPEQIFWEYIMIMFLARDPHPHILQYEPRFCDSKLILTSARHTGSMIQRTWSIGELRLMVGQIGSAIQFLHDAGVFHKDIKPANILWTSGESQLHFVLCDFGNSSFSIDTQPCGTYAFRDPECWRNNKFTAASDIWSLGATIFTLQHRRLMHNCDEHHSYEEVARRVKQALNEYAGNSFLHLDPAQRASLDICKHPDVPVYRTPHWRFEADEVQALATLHEQFVGDPAALKHAIIPGKKIN